MDEKQKPHEAPDFATFITDLDNGRINQLLTDKMAEVVRAVEETGKVGEVSIRFLMKKEGNMAIVGVDVKQKKPEHALHGTLFYIGQNGELLRDDPRQLTLKNLTTPKLKTVAFPMNNAPAGADDEGEEA
jgi:hypothetical protein